VFKKNFKKAYNIFFCEHLLFQPHQATLSKVPQGNNYTCLFKDNIHPWFVLNSYLNKSQHI